MKNKKAKIIILCELIIIALLSPFIVLDNIKIDKEYVFINIPALSGMKIIHISDLHIPKYNINIDKLCEMIIEENPDYIFITGDMTDGYYKVSSGKLESVLEKLTVIAPTYAVLGNHEYWSKDEQIIEEIMTDYGVIVLDGEYTILPYNGEEFLLIGIPENTDYYENLYEGIVEYQGLPAIMLAHHPEHFANYINPNNTIIPNLVLSGHTHGGQFRLPFFGPLFAPGQGFLPQYDWGLYQLDSTYMYISRGLGNSGVPLRLNCPPHLPIIVFN